MNDSKFYISLWKIVGTVVCVLSMTVAGCDSYHTTKQLEMVKAGYTPTQVRCLSLPDNQFASCVLMEKSK